jgi:hypothetical protein
MIKNQEIIKGIFDQKVHQRPFAKGDIVLMWDKTKEKPGMHKKFDSL